ncbi:uncharacterized protein LOC133803988 [Humulus lupulus]|uniref:uncharacterized protein LOC133803988 n=1 Tax=Humulus lupulus TaxID=3486 RepID=UPI002B40A7E6|nr:uncharacterized protein LOC133803988 [Humulus lupulus]
MFDFGDDLTIQSYRIPWLIWAQLLVMLLLILLIYCFFALEPTDNVATITVSSSSSSSQLVSDDTQMNKPFPKHNRVTTVISNRLQNTQVRERRSIKGEITPGSSERIVRGEGNTDREEPSSGISVYFHPCHYFRLARTAFLKCLGLDMEPNPENSSSASQRKRKDR